jgi:hypothetical protein
MPYSTRVHGTIVIGSGARTIPIPVSTKLPPDTPGTFVFDYTADNPEDMTHLDVGDFADWVATNIAAGVFDKSSLPQSLQTVEVALKTLHLETTGTNFAIAVLLGSKGGDSTWKAEWKPVADLPLTLGDVTLDIKQV